MRFDSSCAHRPEARRGMETLEDVVEAASGLRGTDFLPVGDRVLQFQFGWSDPRTGHSQLTLKREPGSPAFHSVTFLERLPGFRATAGAELTATGALEMTTVADAADRASEFTGNAARTVFLPVARTAMRARFGALPPDAVASPRALLLERVEASHRDDEGVSTGRPPRGTVTKQAKFLDGAARSYFEHGLSCSVVDGGKEEDAWAACLCQAP